MAEARCYGYPALGWREDWRKEPSAFGSARLVFGNERRGRGSRDGAFYAGHCGKGGRCSRGCHLSNSWCCGLLFGGGFRGGGVPQRVTQSHLVGSFPAPSFNRAASLHLEVEARAARRLRGPRPAVSHSVSRKDGPVSEPELVPLQTHQEQQTQQEAEPVPVAVPGQGARAEALQIPGK